LLKRGKAHQEISLFADKHVCICLQDPGELLRLRVCPGQLLKIEIRRAERIAIAEVAQVRAQHRDGERMTAYFAREAVQGSVLALDSPFAQHCARRRHLQVVEPPWIVPGAIPALEIDEGKSGGHQRSRLATAAGNRAEKELELMIH
jgi:hypothetical protein